ncbi:MAG TPA: hypothetical protein PKE32_09845 [Miltoncostaeaceae bacterium]|nr:hypothetical protein [Miltoncostaeaceae bacterium]
MPPFARRLLIAPLALCAAAAPAAAWTSGQTVSPTDRDGRTPAVAMNASGAAVLAWVDGPWDARGVVVARRSDRGGWESPVRVSSREGVAIDPAVAIDGTGGVIVVWRQRIGDQWRTVGGRTVRRPVWVVRARGTDRDGRWGPVATLSPTRLKVGAPRVAADADGNAVAVWHWGTGTQPSSTGFVGQVQAATLVDGRWSRARRLSGTPGCREERQARVAMSTNGDALVWWVCDRRARAITITLPGRPADGVWGERAPSPLRPNGDIALAGDGTVGAVDADRDGTVRWWRADRPNDRPVAFASLPRPGTGERARGGAGPRIAIADDGDAMSAWVAAGRTGDLRVAPVAAALGPGSALTLPGMSPAAGVRVLAGAQRQAATIWVAGAGTPQALVLAAGRGADGRWSTPVALSPTPGGITARSLGVAGTARTAIAAWERTTSGGRHVIVLSQHTAP